MDVPKLYTAHTLTGERKGISVQIPRPATWGYILESQGEEDVIKIERCLTTQKVAAELHAVIHGLERIIQNHSHARVLATNTQIGKAIRSVLVPSKREEFRQLSRFRLTPENERLVHFDQFDQSLVDPGQLDRLRDVVNEMRVEFYRMNASDRWVRNHEIHKQTQIENIIFTRQVGWPDAFRSSDNT